jgi:hypothetical protein
MEPLRVRFIDRKGFSLDEWITEKLAPVVTKRFALEPYGDPEGERSVVLTFQRVEQEGTTVIYREVLS